MECRDGCGACCVGLSISSSMPGYPKGKPAGQRCKHLSIDYRCGIYEERPKVCQDFRAELQFCGSDRSEALRIFADLEDSVV